MERDGSWPIVWDRARGATVWDADGQRYVDLTAAFGVAAAGHANRQVVRAGQAQMAKLLHAMGDVHPHPLKGELAARLSRLTFERWSRAGRGSLRRRGKSLFCNSGFEAVEAALKTASRATGRPGVIAFEGAYHGVGYGTLSVTHRPHFRAGLGGQLKRFGTFLPFPAADPSSEVEGTLTRLEKQLHQTFRKQSIGAVLVEPFQARGGIQIPPVGFLKLLRRVCDQHGALLILDEIYTGFGRTGRWFACEHEKVIPDLICLGKALTGGFPLSVCVGEASWMDRAWPPSSGEAIHTSTFLGHPVGCAMALAQIEEIDRLGLVERSDKLGAELLGWLDQAARRVEKGHAVARGIGLMVGLELLDRAGKPDTARSLQAMKSMLRSGFVILPEGEQANVLGWTPPLTIGARDLQRSVSVMEACLI